MIHLSDWKLGPWNLSHLTFLCPADATKGLLW